MQEGIIEGNLKDGENYAEVDNQTTITTVDNLEVEDVEPLHIQQCQTAMEMERGIQFGFNKS